MIIIIIIIIVIIIISEMPLIIQNYLQKVIHKNHNIFQMLFTIIKNA